MRNYKLIKDYSSSFIKGENVNIGERVEIRCLDRSQIIIRDNVKLDNDVRIVVVGKGVLILNEGSKLGKGTIVNVGHSKVSIGQNTASYMNVLIYTSNHIMGDHNFRTNYSHKDVFIGANCLLGSSCVICPGSIIPDNTFIQHNSVYEVS